MPMATVPHVSPTRTSPSRTAKDVAIEALKSPEKKVTRNKMGASKGGNSCAVSKLTNRLDQLGTNNKGGSKSNTRRKLSEIVVPHEPVQKLIRWGAVYFVHKCCNAFLTDSTCVFAWCNFCYEITKTMLEGADN